MPNANDHSPRKNKNNFFHHPNCPHYQDDSEKWLVISTFVAVTVASTLFVSRWIKSLEQDHARLTLQEHTPASLFQTQQPTFLPMSLTAAKVLICFLACYIFLNFSEKMLEKICNAVNDFLSPSFSK